MPFDELKYERENFRNIGDMVKSLKVSINRLINQYSELLSKELIKNRNSDNVRLYKKNIDSLVKALNKLIYQRTELSIVNAIDLANSKNDDLVNYYAEAFTASPKITEGMVAGSKFAVDSFVKRKAAGLNLSDRVWKVSQSFRDSIEYYIQEGLGTGKSAKSLAKELQQFLNEPDKLFRRVRGEDGVLRLSKPAKAYHPGQGVYRSSYQNAFRLAATETNIAYRSADFERRSRIPFILGYNVKLSGSHPRYDICDILQGEYPKSFVFTGWHPRCLCYTTSIYLPKNEMKEFFKTGKIAGEKYTKDIPKPATDFIKENGDKIKGMKSEPYFIKDNFKYSQKDGYTLKK